MSTNVLNTHISTEIILTSSGTYLSPFTISQTGAIQTSANYGVFSALGSPVLVNVGAVKASALDVVFLNGGTIVNVGTLLSTSVDAVYMRTGGTVFNYGTGSQILGEVQIDLLSGDVVNQGTINAAGFFGVLLTAGGSVNNAGTISGTETGIFLNTGGGGVTNSGVIRGGIISGIGLNDGGTVANDALISFISGSLDGVIVSNHTGVVTNDGQIIGGTGIGIDLGAGGTVVNYGNVSGGLYGIGISGSAGTVINNGVISSTAHKSVKLQAGGTLTNNGVINGAVYLNGSGTANRLIVGTNAVFNGAVKGSASASNALELEAGTGTVNGVGLQFTGFQTIAFDPGTYWRVNGYWTGLTTGQTISGFTFGDTIGLNGFGAVSDSFVSGTGLVLSDGVSTQVLDITGNFTTADFSVHSQNNSTVIEMAVPCFCPGTRIATARGNVPVEALDIGDLVKTATQGFQPIRWIGRRAYDGRFITGNHLALPVKIRRHALGFNVPSRDMFVSPGHAICEGGVLVHAWRLVNGVSITQAESVEQVEYFHVELDRHAVIFAENTPVESFLDNGCRAQFQNAASAPETVPQEPCLPLIEDGFYLARLRARIDARAGIAPPAAPGPLRGNIDRTEPRIFGWAQDETAPEVPVELELLCGGVAVGRVLANRYRADLRQAGLGSGCHAFELALPALAADFALRRVSDGALLGEFSHQVEKRRA